MNYELRIIPNNNNGAPIPVTSHESRLSLRHHQLTQKSCKVMSMWSLRWHFTNRSFTGAPSNIKVTICHTAGHYSEDYDDWNSNVLRSWQNCSSDGAELTDGGRA